MITAADTHISIDILEPDPVYGLRSKEALKEKDWFALGSCRDQLQLLKALGFSPETVDD